MFDLIVANNRLAHWIEGDLESMVGACQLAARRISALLERHGLDVVRQALRANIAYSERRVRAEIATWTDGEHVAETFVDHDYFGHRDIRIRCTATVRGSDLTLDFTGTAPQVPGFVNSPLANTLSFVFLAVATCCDEDIPINEGYMSPVTVIAPDGTLVNPRRPAPVGRLARRRRSLLWHSRFGLSEFLHAARSQYRPWPQLDHLHDRGTGALHDGLPRLAVARRRGRH